MKTRLLKRLRKNANEHYRVVESKYSRRKIYTVEYYLRHYGWDALVGRCFSKEEAIERCKLKMRTYIISSLEVLRMKKSKNSPLNVVYGGNVSFWTKLLRML